MSDLPDSEDYEQKTEADDSELNPKMSSTQEPVVIQSDELNLEEQKGPENRNEDTDVDKENVIEEQEERERVDEDEADEEEETEMFQEEEQEISDMNDDEESEQEEERDDEDTGEDEDRDEDELNSPEQDDKSEIEEHQSSEDESSSAALDDSNILFNSSTHDDRTSVNNAESVRDTYRPGSKSEEPSQNSSSKTRELHSSGRNSRNQMMNELYRVRSQLIRTASSISRPSIKPYTPDIFNDLSPYYNKYMVDCMINDQDPYYKSWRKYGQRSTALGIIEPEKSLMMDRMFAPYTYSKVQAQLWTPKSWSKNTSGKEDNLGSTRLPPVPNLRVTKLENPKYNHFKMTYAEVPSFRRDMQTMRKEIADKRLKDDFRRVEMDWKRMNLSELKELPIQSRFHVSKAVVTYLGTSKGSLRAANKLGKEIGVPTTISGY